MRSLVLLAALTLPLAACGGGSDDSFDGEVEDAEETGLFDRMGQMRDAVEQIEEAAQRPPADPVNFRDLRALLPDEVAGIAQGETEGATDGMAGFSISRVNAEYPGEEQHFDIEITDMGAIPSAAMFGLAWTMADIDRESGSVSERTVEFGGERGYRKYDSESRDGEFSLLVADRFHVQVSGDNVDEDEIEAALRAVDLSALAGMRDAGRPDA